jgi:hypothetical protein
MSVNVVRGHVKVLSFQEHLPACVPAFETCTLQGFS